MSSPGSDVNDAAQTLYKAGVREAREKHTALERAKKACNDAGITPAGLGHEVQAAIDAVEKAVVFPCVQECTTIDNRYWNSYSCSQSPPEDRVTYAARSDICMQALVQINNLRALL